MSSPAAATTDDVRKYWNQRIHDLEITTHPVGSAGFFADLDQYHFEKLHHLLRLVNFDGYAGRQVLERLEVTQPDVRLQRDLSGRNNWQFGDPLKKGTLKLPTIEHFVLTDGHVGQDDKLRKRKEAEA